ncbi:MAG: hypothetical protein MK364_18360, partial [Pirellulales bacterium]|nr:hypothetical protein [Pirellulales bacterium]
YQTRISGQPWRNAAISPDITEDDESRRLQSGRRHATSAAIRRDFAAETIPSAGPRGMQTACNDPNHGKPTD